jgi:hypothetical protein
VAQNATNRSPAIDGRTTRHPGHALSRRIRKRIEEAFGWTKVPGGLRKTRHRGLARVGWSSTLTAGAYDLIRIPKLLEAWCLPARARCSASGGSPLDLADLLVDGRPRARIL